MHNGGIPPATRSMLGQSRCHQFSQSTGTVIGRFQGLLPIVVNTVSTAVNVVNLAMKERVTWGLRVHFVSSLSQDKEKKTGAD